MILDFQIALGEREVPSDFASRLSTAACRDDFWEFCRDFGLDGQGIVDASDGAVEALAELAHVDARSMLNEAFKPFVRKRDFIYKGQHLVQHNLMRARVRACPRCMAEDIKRLDLRRAARPHRRSEWIVGAIRTCAIHDVALVELSDGGPASHRHDTSRAFAYAVTRLPQYLKEASERSPSLFELYVANRLAGEASSPWLDGLPLHAALRLTLVVGAVIKHGSSINLDSLDDAQRWESEAAGFDVLSDGEDRIRGFLDELQEAFARSRGPSGPRAIFGRLYEFLAFENEAPGYQPMRDLLSDHISRTLPISVNAGMFNRQPAPRRVHSLHSAAKEFKLEPQRLRKLLKATGIITSETDGMSNGRVLFDAEAAEATMHDIASSLTLGEAAKHLDVSEDHLRALMAEGYIKPMIAGGTDVLKNYAFRPADLNAFLFQLLGEDPSKGSDLRRAEPLPRAAELTCRKLVDVVRMVIAKKLSWVGVRHTANGLNSVLVDIDELKSLITGSQLGWMKLREAEKEIHVTTSVLSKLISCGFIKVIIIRNSIHGGPQRVIKIETLERFNQEYVTLFSIAREKKTQISQMKKILTKAGIEPVVPQSVLGCTLYLRADLNP